MELFTQLNPQTTIVTPNRRLAATLLKNYNLFQSANHNACWERLDILPFSSWIQRLWQEYCAANLEISPLILTTQQEQVLWEEILHQSPTNDALLQLSATAELAKTAWGILKQWQVNPELTHIELTEDSSAFQLWAQQFQSICTKNHWIDNNTLMDLVSEKIAAQKIHLPKHLILTGFTEYSPQQKHLFNLCTTQGIEVKHHSACRDTHDQTIQRIALTDEDTEIRCMANWAKSLRQQGKDLNIGCVVPNLEKVRDKILHTFTNVFSEEHTFTLDPTTLPFNISAGKTLATYAIIHSALQLLSLNTKNLTNEDIIHLLHSPFLGDAESERIQRADFDSRLRNANIHIHSLNKFIHHHHKINISKYCPKLTKRLETLVCHLDSLKKFQLPSHWASIFVELLTLLGWPGERSLNSQEYQVVQRWLELLNEYRSLDNILPPQTYQQALHYLNQLAIKTVFQIQSPEAPIQILGLLEAAEIPFDYLWVMGLDDNTWPPAAKPNPFIPQRLQKTLQMPHANAEKELAYSMQLTKQLKQGAKHCIFSHALKSADSELRPSALILDVDEITLEQLHFNINVSASQLIFESRQLEIIQDSQANPVINADKIHGGVRIFKQQAACGFKAFAEIRLYAQKLESLKIGLRPQDRGTIVHKALELIWKTLKNSENLNNIDQEDLLQLIHTCSAQAIEQATHKKVDATRYLSLELQRLENLIFNWLNLEKDRPAFTVISQEEECIATVGNIPLNMRVDRIDELADGTRLIIDYKTGKNNQIKYWFTERPDEPQLPLYCLTQPLNTTGIAFAEIHPDNLSFKGISKNDIDIPAILPIFKVSHAENRQWEQQIQQWQMTLEQIGNDFHQGKANVNPKEDETCQFCHLQALCRVYEKVEPV